MVIDVLFAQVQASRGTEQGAFVVRGAAWSTGKPSLCPAVRALSAAREERHRHVVTDSEIVDAGAERLDDARRFMAEQHGHRPRARAVHHRQIGVADSGGLDAHEDLTRSSWVELELDDRERKRLGVWPRLAELVQHRSGDSHVDSLMKAATRSMYRRPVSTFPAEVKMPWVWCGRWWCSTCAPFLARYPA